jgi:hypothetical protein
MQLLERVTRNRRMISLEKIGTDGFNALLFLLTVDVKPATRGRNFSGGDTEEFFSDSPKERILAIGPRKIETSWSWSENCFVHRPIMNCKLPKAWHKEAETGSIEPFSA